MAKTGELAAARKAVDAAHRALHRATNPPPRFGRPDSETVVALARHLLACQDRVKAAGG